MVSFKFTLTSHLTAPATVLSDMFEVFQVPELHVYQITLSSDSVALLKLAGDWILSILPVDLSKTSGHKVDPDEYL
jgi:hypothetical protein